MSDSYNKLIRNSKESKEKEEEYNELKELLDYICCPNCSGELELIFKDNFPYYKCKNCSKEYMIKDNIPILLFD